MGKREQKKKAPSWGAMTFEGARVTPAHRERRHLIDGINVGGADSFGGVVKLNPNLKYVTPEISQAGGQFDRRSGK